VTRRTVLFLDYQNVYQRARDAFHQPTDPSPSGQIDPIKLGRLLIGRDPGRELTEVRVYRGQPDASKDPKGYGANRRQVAAWEQAGATVIHRPLRYPFGWPRERPEEKGIDVILALDFVTMAARGDYEVGILMSTDTDLKPALEEVVALGSNRNPHCEVAAWSAPGAHSRRLSIRGAHVWCHWLGPDDYKQVADPTDYNLDL
jgi:uncharacterized LabA/DUF88 family protein